MSELKIYGHEPTETAWGTPTPQREPKLKATVNWSTRIVESPRSGLEYRTPLITEPRYEIEGSDFVLTDESYATLSQAFRGAKGRALAFPFKNPIDYYCTESPEILAEDVYQQGFIVPVESGKSVLVKQFHCKGVNAYKTQLFPIAETLTVDGLTVDANGLIEGAGGSIVPCGGEYRQLYRFDVSDLQLTQIKRALDEFDVNVYQTVNFRLIEDSYNKSGWDIVSGDWIVNIDFDLIGLPHADITYSDRIVSRIEQSISRKELREEVNVVTQNIILESGNLNRLNTQVFLTIYNVCKGRLNGINFDGNLSRFDSDTLGIDQLGANAFAINGVPLRSVESPFSKIDRETYIIPFVDLTSLTPAEIANIEESIVELRRILSFNVYGSEGLGNKYVKAPVGLLDERYMRWPSVDYRDSPDEPKKYLFLAFVDEVDGIAVGEPTRPEGYHHDPRNASLEPTSLWTSDYNTLMSVYPDFERFNYLVFAPTSNPPRPSHISFNPHIIDVVAGNNGYPRMRDFNVDAKPYWPIDATGADIFSAIIQFIS